jgi:hypothetical protein
MTENVQVRADGQGGMTGNVREGKVGGTVQFSETSEVRREAGGTVPVLFTPPPIPTGLQDSSRIPTGLLDSSWIPTGLLDSSWIPTGFLLDFQSNRSPVGIPESSRSPTGLLLDFNHFSGKNLIATELQYKTVIVN